MVRVDETNNTSAPNGQDLTITSAITDGTGFAAP